MIASISGLLLQAVQVIAYGYVLLVMVRLIFGIEVKGEGEVVARRPLGKLVVNGLSGLWASTGLGSGAKEDTAETQHSKREKVSS